MATGSHLVVWRFSVGGTGGLSSGQATRGSLNFTTYKSHHIWKRSLWLISDQHCYLSPCSVRYFHLQSFQLVLQFLSVIYSFQLVSTVRFLPFWGLIRAVKCQGLSNIQCASCSLTHSLPDGQREKKPGIPSVPWFLNRCEKFMSCSSFLLTHNPSPFMSVFLEDLENRMYPKYP